MGTFTAVYEKLQLSLPFQLTRIINLHIEESLNNHAHLSLEGYLEEGVILEDMQRVSLQDTLQVQKLEEEPKMLFLGIPIHISITHDGAFWKLSLKAMSYSLLLDFKKNRRSFQNPDETYHDMMRKVVKAYPEGMLAFQGEDKVKNCSILQYDETDWQWLLRMASHLGVVIYPYMEQKGPKLYVGLHTRKTYGIDASWYQLRKELGASISFKENYGDAMEEDFEDYTVQSENNYPLGEQCIVLKKTYRIVRKVTVYQLGQVLHTYNFKRETGIQHPKTYTSTLKGVGIQGKVLARQKDKLKVHLAIDEVQQEVEAFWYPFSTTYTTEGQTGWYAMPEVGANITLFIPSHDEEEAYVGAINRTDGKENPKTQDSTIQYFGTKEQKEMMLAPDTILFHTTKRQIALKLDDKEGISVTSEKDIHLYTAQNFTLEADIFTCQAKDKLILATDKTSIIIDQVTHITG